MYSLKEEDKERFVETRPRSLCHRRLIMFVIALALGGLTLNLLNTEISALSGMQDEDLELADEEQVDLASSLDLAGVAESLEMVEDTSPAVSAEPVALKPNGERYRKLRLSEADKLLLAQMLYHEARSEPRSGQLALIEATLNRLLDPNFPETVEEVVYQEGQYATAELLAGTEPLPEQFEAIEAVLAGEYVLPGALEDGRLVVFFAKSAENSHVAAKIGAHVFCYAYNWTQK